MQITSAEKSLRSGSANGALVGAIKEALLNLETVESDLKTTKRRLLHHLRQIED